MTTDTDTDADSRSSTLGHSSQGPAAVLRLGIVVEGKSGRGARSSGCGIRRCGRLRSSMTVRWRGGCDRLGLTDALDHAMTQAVERQFQSVGDSQLVVNFAKIILDHLFGGAYS